MKFHNGYLVEVYRVPLGEKVGDRLMTLFVKSEREGIEKRVERLLEEPSGHYRFAIHETRFMYNDEEDRAVYDLTDRFVNKDGLLRLPNIIS